MEADVIIVGGGLTGLATAWHLSQAGGISCLVLDAGETVGASETAAGMVTGGQFDNFSRVAHAHGQAFGAELWRFGDAAYDALLAHCRAHGIPHAEKRRLRWLVSPEERREAEQAVAGLTAAGLAPQVQEGPALARAWPGLGARVTAVQDDGARGAWVDVPALLAQLRRAVGDRLRRAKVVAVKARPAGVTLGLAGGGEAKAQMVVLANHLGIGELLPFYRKVLISVADQWSAWETEGPLPPWWGPGLALSAHHGYEWGVVDGAGTLRWGGARFLRRWAGIEATEATVDPKGEAYLAARIRETLPALAQARATRTVAGLDVRPCDELPVIGPDFTDQRVLVAAGFMGTGLSLGFLAGLCLTEIMKGGASARLPERLAPRRLRSLGG